MQEESSAGAHFAQRFGMAALIVAGQALLIVLVWLFFKWLRSKVAANKGGRVKGLSIKQVRILTAKQIIGSLLVLLNISKWVITAFQLFITVPLVFSLFPSTEKLASLIFGYILTPLKRIGRDLLAYIPNLFTIVVVLVLVRYLLKALRFVSTQIARGKVRVPGFYADWAQPTYNIVRFLLYAFTIAVIFPYLPGSSSRIFQGVSVFVGIIFSIGSTSVIGNLVGGMVLTYMRPFKIGDFIEIQGNRGFVVQKSLMVMRVRTTKNEYITYPNLQILQGSIINYNRSLEEENDPSCATQGPGLILHTEITFNYATEWRTVHALLIGAALKTTHVLSEPRPFVLQRGLDDNYARYEINCYTRAVEKMPAIYSELFEHIQDDFAAAGLDLTAPQYRLNLPVESRGRGPWEDAGSHHDH
jgi:small-conductance mechanosensitive channel